MKAAVKIAISGVKNSGKTTLIEKLLPALIRRGIRTAVIKHDGHDFEGDVPGTDSYRISRAGAFGTAVFSESKYLLQKEDSETDQERKAEQLAKSFPEADLILLEGFKNSSYPKFEVVRAGNSKESVCIGENLLAIVSDFEPDHPEEIPVFGLEDAERIASFIEEILRSETVNISKENLGHASCKVMLFQDEYFFGPGVFHLLQKISETGSIRSAAAAIGLSYSKACKMINRAERGSGVHFLERTVGGKNGGKSVLTQEGARYLQKYKLLLEESEKAVSKLYHEIFTDCGER